MNRISSFSLPRIVRIGASAFLFGLAGTLAAHPAGDFLPDIPGAVTLLTPDQIRNAAFLPDSKNNPLFLAFQEIQDKLEANHVRVKVHSLAVSGDGYGFLLNSSASPATIRYILKYKLLGEQIIWTETGSADDPVFNLTIQDEGAFRITFPAKDWLLCSAVRPPEPADDPSEKKTAEAKESAPPVSAAELLKAIPDGVAMAYVWPAPGATPEYPLTGELKSLSFYILRDAEDKRPVHTEIKMPAKSTEAARKIQNACQDSIRQVYEEAAKNGRIPSELVNAFTVTRKDAEVAIHIVLPDDMAKYFFTTFAEALQGMVRPFAVPDTAQAPTK